MQTGRHILFWVIVSVFLIIGFGSTYGDYIKSFYFVTFLLPVAMGTSYFFNYYLVPEYLLKRHNLRFTIYTLYAIIVSLYLQMIVITLSFVLIANYDIQEMDPIMLNIFVLATVIYLIVLLKSFFLLFRRVRNHEFRERQLISEKEALKTEFITIRSDRKNYQIELEKLIFIESMSDYVKIHTSDGVFTTKETISAFEKSLPEYFIRIHRSFIVNQHYVSRFQANELKVNGIELPISRTYKVQALEILTAGEYQK